MLRARPCQLRNLFVLFSCFHALRQHQSLQEFEPRGALGQAAHFLFKHNTDRESDPAVPEYIANESLIARMIGIRAFYLLHAATLLLKKGDGNLIEFQDCKADDLMKVLAFLELNESFVNEVEAHLCMSKSLQDEFRNGSTTGWSQWAASWVKVVNHVLNKFNKAGCGAHVTKDMLPSPLTIVKDSLLGGQAGSGSGVKNEEAERKGDADAAKAKAEKSEGKAAVAEDASAPSFADIYCMNELHTTQATAVPAPPAEPVNVMDIVAIQKQIEVHLLMNATKQQAQLSIEKSKATCLATHTLLSLTVKSCMLLCPDHHAVQLLC